MGFFGFGKKERIVDLGQRYKKQQEREMQVSSEPVDTSSLLNDSGSENSATQNSGGAFGFLSSIASTTSSDSVTSDSLNQDSEDYVDVSSGVNEKRKRLAKRLMDMTEKIEELSNQIYHLQQRIEVLEKKNNVGSFG